MQRTPQIWMRITKGLLFAILCTFITAGCFRVPAKFALTVKVTDSDGKSVENAEVFFDDRIVGFTDDNGQFQRAIKTFAPNPHQLRIKAHKDGSYFSKYEELLDLEKLPNGEVQISAKLYAVEKPSGGSALLGAAPSKDVTESEVPAPEQIPAVASETAEPTSVESKSASDDLEAPVLPEAQIADSPSEPADEKVANAETSNDEPQVTSANEPVTVTPSHSENTKETVHVFYRGKPVEGACVDTALDGTCACTTPASGRCSVDVHQTSDYDGKSFAIVRKNGFKSQILEMQKNYQSGVPISKIEIEQGSGSEVFVSESLFFRKSPVANAKISQNGTVFAVTDLAGFAFVPRGVQGSDTEFLVERGLEQAESTKVSITEPGSPLHIAFSSKREFQIRTAIADVGYAGNFSGHDMLSSTGIGPRTIFNAVRKEVFSSHLTQQLPRTILDEIARDSGKSVRDVIDWGWGSVSSNHHADAVVVPMLVNGADSGVALSVRVSSGDIAWAKFIPVNSPFSWDVVEREVGRAAATIKNHLPISAHVQQNEGNVVSIKASSNGFRKGERLKLIWQDGMSQYQRANFVVQTFEKGSTKLTGIEDVALPKAGTPLMVLRMGEDAKGKVSSFVLKGGLGRCPRAIYFSGSDFAGSNDVGCEMNVRSTSGSGMIVAESHQPQSLRSDVGDSVEVSLKAANPIVRIATVPSSAMVKINGRNVGYSPVNASVRLGDFPAKVELSGAAGFRDQELSLSKANTNLTGAFEVKLEPRELDVNNSH